MGLLTAEQLQSELSALPLWRHIGKAIERELKFRTFADAMRFVNQVAELAENANHHPDIDIRYTTVQLSLTSHDSGGLTQRDIRLAKRIEQLLGED